MTDSSGGVKRRFDYLPFGEDLLAGIGGRTTAMGYNDGTTVQQPDKTSMKFTGKERDAESGLDYFGARYFSAAQGRFTSPDWSAAPEPIPYADLNDPQTLNLYGYVRNNPVARPDLDGHCDAANPASCMAEGAQMGASLGATGEAVGWGLGAVVALAARV